MKISNIDEYKNGWFVGDFSPTVLSTDACEVAIKYYKAGEKEDSHMHKVAIEVTAVVSGKVRMNDKEWSDGDIIHLDPGEVTNFEAISDAITVVVKTPSIKNDKYKV